MAMSVEFFLQLLRLKKINCMSQSFCFFWLIQQNSSFLFFFACLIFFKSFLWTCLLKYMKRHDRHNKTHFTTDFFNSVFCLVSCLSINQVPYFILSKVVTDQNLTHLLLRKTKQNKTKQNKTKQNKTKKKNVKKKKKRGIKVRSSNLSQALRHRIFFF